MQKSSYQQLPHVGFLIFFGIWLLLFPYIIWAGMHSYSELPKRIFSTGVLLVLILLLSVLACVKKTAVKVQLHWIDVLPIGFFLYTLLSSLWSINILYAQSIIWTWVCSYILYIFLRSYHDKKILQQITIWIFSLHGLILGTICTVQYFGGWTGIPQSSEPAAGTFANKAIMAHFWALTLPFVIYGIISFRGKITRSVIGFSLLFGCLGFCTTLSRAAYLGATVMIFLSAILFVRYFLSKKRLILFGGTSTVVLFILGFAFSDIIADRLLISVQKNTAERPLPTVPADLQIFEKTLQLPFATPGQPLPFLFNSQSFNDRLSKYLNSTHLFYENFPRGIGTNQFQVYYPSAVYKGYEDRHLQQIGATYAKTHNDVLQIALEMGLMGAAAIVFVIFYLAYWWYKSLTKKPPINWHTITIVMLSGFLVIACVDYPLYSAAPPVLIAILLALSTNTCAKRSFTLPKWSLVLVCLLTIGTLAYWLPKQSNTIDSDIAFNLSQKYMQIGKHQEVIKYANVALHFEPRKAEAYNFAGRAALILQDYHLAEKYLENSLSLTPYAAFNLHTLAEAKFYLKKMDEAKMLFLQHVLAHPRDAISWSRLGTIFALEKNNDSSIQAFFNATLFNRKNPNNPHDLAIQCFQAKRYKEAEQALVYTIKEFPDWGKSYATIGLLYLYTPSLKKQSRAKEFLLKSRKFPLDKATSTRVSQALDKIK